MKYSLSAQCANIGPASYNYDETISTLRYANRAKNICNKAKINEDPKDALLRRLQDEIKTLRGQLEGTVMLLFRYRGCVKEPLVQYGNNTEAPFPFFGTFLPFRGYFIEEDVHSDSLCILHLTSIIIYIIILLAFVRENQDVSVHLQAVCIIVVG